MNQFKILIKGGKFANIPKGFRDKLKELEGKDAMVTIKEYKENRSQRQNRYLWSLIGIMEEETGTEKEYLHNYFKLKFLWDFEEHELTNENIEARGRLATTTDLDTKEFTVYIEKIRRFAAEKGFYLPSPEEIGIEF